MQLRLGNIFAECLATDRSVEPVKDSSRYFVLTLEDGQGRRAFIGLGFTERNEAFDFNAALADHKKYLRQLQEAEKAGQYWANQPKLDFSIPQGQSIHVNLKASTTAVRQCLTGVICSPSRARQYRAAWRVRVVVQCCSLHRPALALARSRTRPLRS